MRQVKLQLTIDLDSGKYEMNYNNLSHPGEDINYSELVAAFRKVMDSVEEKSEYNNNLFKTKGYKN